MINIIDKYKCCGCGACVNICPQSCITMIADIEGFLYPTVNLEKCIRCGLCEKACVYLLKNKSNRVLDGKIALGIVNKNEVKRLESSSGGFFYSLAEYVISKGGAVYGVSMDEDNKSCSFRRVTSILDLNLIQGSKYIQANVGCIYKHIKQDLIQGKKVLFSGTPCQISGLNSFLNNNYENLISVEIICHGVPSPKIWKKYVCYLENKYNDTFHRVNFRDKRMGWKEFGLLIEGKEQQYFNTLNIDPFLIMFLRNYSLRPSCYNCYAKRFESKADFIIGDFWGVDKCMKNIDDDKGTSLVVLNTDRAHNLLAGISSFFSIYPVKNEDFLMFNPAIHSSVKEPKRRKRYFYDSTTLSFDVLANKYCKKNKLGTWINHTFLIRGFRKVMRIIRKK